MSKVYINNIKINNKDIKKFLNYFNKNIINTKFCTYRFYRYKVYIQMDKNYNNTLIDKQLLVKILETYIDNSYTSYSINYDNISKLYTIEYYTD